MCDLIFESRHLDMINRLSSQEHLQYSYIKQLVVLKETELRDQMAAYQLAKPSDTHKILSLQVSLMCKLEPANVVIETKKIKKLGFYPIESLLITYR